MRSISFTIDSVDTEIASLGTCLGSISFSTFSITDLPDFVLLCFLEKGNVDVMSKIVFRTENNNNYVSTSKLLVAILCNTFTHSNRMIECSKSKLTKIRKYENRAVLINYFRVNKNF